MNRIATPSLLAFALLAATASLATAAVPSPANSTTPPCLAPCPMGDVAFTVVVRDVANNPDRGQHGRVRVLELYERVHLPGPAQRRLLSPTCPTARCAQPRTPPAA